MVFRIPQSRRYGAAAPLLLSYSPGAQVFAENLRLIVGSVIQHQIHSLKIDVGISQKLHVLIISIHGEIVQRPHSRHNISPVPPVHIRKRLNVAVLGGLQRHILNGP